MCENKFKRLSLSSSSHYRGVERVARFLLLLDKEDAANILRQLPEDLVEKISTEIANIDTISKEDAKTLLQSFDLKTLIPSIKGGKLIAENILKKAFGEVYAREMIKKAIPLANSFVFLHTQSDDTILRLIEKESVATMALILTQIPAKKAATVLRLLPAEKQAVLAKHMAQTKEINSSVIHQVAQSIRKKLHSQEYAPLVEIDGIERISEILRFTDEATQENILKYFEDHDKNLAEKIEESLFKIELIPHIDDKQLQQALQKTEDSQLAHFIQGKDPEIVEKILSNISERRKTRIVEELPPHKTVTKKKIIAATKEMLAFFRNLEKNGEIIIEE